MNSDGSEWKAAFVAEEAVLSRLVQDIPEHFERDRRTTRGLYRSKSFDNLASAAEVSGAAAGELSTIAGILDIELGRSVNLTTAGVERHGPGDALHLFQFHHESVLALDGADAKLTHRTAAGELASEAPARSRMSRAARLARADAAVAKVFRLRAASDGQVWTGLYRMLEVIIEDVGGTKAFDSMGWGAKALRRNFERTAGSVHGAGDLARHGSEATDPPKTPMTLDDAREFIRSVTVQWLVGKGA